LFSQDLEKKQKLETSFITTINEIEKLTKLNFFPILTKTMENKIENALAGELW
jgi:endonuclease G